MSDYYAAMQRLAERCQDLPPIASRIECGHGALKLIRDACTGGAALPTAPTDLLPGLGAFGPEMFGVPVVVHEDYRGADQYGWRALDGFGEQLAAGVLAERRR